MTHRPLAVLMLGVVSLLVAPLQADDLGPDKVESIVGERLLGPYHTNGKAVREAFKPIVAGPREATVQILVGGEQVALGTIIDSNGWILTKASELGDAEKIVCRFANRSKLSARLVGIVTAHDLAMLKIDRVDLPTIAWANERTPEVGTWTVTPGPSTRCSSCRCGRSTRHPRAVAP